jgi:enoyl-CoA hydratase
VTPDLVGSTRHGVGDDGAVAVLLTLNRPEQLNPIDSAMLEALDARLDEIAGDPAVRAVLVTGTGRAFSAGGDLKGYRTLQRDPVAFPRFVSEVHRIFGRLRTMPVPTIALVNGVAVAGGLELILNCDLVFAGSSARIGDGHLNFGQMGGGGVLTLLWRAVGRARALELMMSGRQLTPAEANEWGLVNRVVPDVELLEAGLAFVRDLATKSPLALANAKQVMHEIWAAGGPVDAGLSYELARDAYYCLTSEDAQEGLAAFAEKRRPRFTGR